MDDGGRPHLGGRDRRYMLSELLWERGPMTVAELAEALAADGWSVGGRASKTISDCLRWEIAHGRVVRLARGLYGPGRMPKQTKSWIRCRNRRTREEFAERLSQVRQNSRPFGSAPPFTNGAGRHGADHGEPAHPADDAVDVDTANVGRGVPDLEGGPARPRARREGRDADGAEEVVVVGGGWSEEDDAADDEAMLLALLARRRSGRLSDGGT